MSKARQLADLGGDTANLEDISSAYSSGPLSNRNLIINGAMQVAQRGTSFNHTSNLSYYTLDRWRLESAGLDAFDLTLSQSTDAPDGFGQSIKFQSNTNGTQTVSGTDYLLLAQKTEQQNIDQIAYGTSNAKQVTVSFWIKSSVTGSWFECGIRRTSSSVGTRSIFQGVTINSADTWEYKTFTFPADTTGTPTVAANAKAFDLFFSFHGLVGGARTSEHGVWQTGNYVAGPYGGTDSFLGTSGNTLYLTGVQLEVGDTATPFEHKSYGQELALCQRYYWRTSDAGVGNFPLIQGVVSASSQYISSPISFPVEMRAQPTCAINGTWQVSNVSAIQAEFQSRTGVCLRILSSGSPTIYAYANSSDDYISADAEL
jgi:hypothetical protein